MASTDYLLDIAAEISTAVSAAVSAARVKSERFNIAGYTSNPWGQLHIPHVVAVAVEAIAAHKDGRRFARMRDSQGVLEFLMDCAISAALTAAGHSDDMTSGTWCDVEDRIYHDLYVATR